MAALKAASIPCLQTHVPFGVGHCFELAVETFNGVSSCSPSLAALGNILRHAVNSGKDGGFAYRTP